MLDRVFPLLMRLVQRSDRNWQDETFYDYAAKKLQRVDGIVLSRIKGRLESETLPTVLRVIGDVGTGEFDGFETSIAGEEHTSDEALTIRALDLTKAGSDSILGKQLNLIELLPSGLKDVSAAISMGNFEGVANAPAEEIARARDDAKNSLAIAPNLYEANRWIYGDGAFGLRLASWIARKAPDVLVDSTTLLMFVCGRSRTRSSLQTRSLKWRSKLPKSVSSQRGMSGTGATILASRKSSIPNELNWPSPMKLR
jgi:hypothetical protein